MFGPPITKAESFFRLERSFTEKEVKSIYKKACFRWHPDRNGGSEESREDFSASMMQKMSLYDC